MIRRFRVPGLLLLVAALSIHPGLADGGGGAPAPWSGFPRLAGTLPEVESRILGALRAARLAGRLIRIAADTNGRLTVAGIWFTYSATSPNPLPALQSYAWNVLRLAFAADPTVDEVDLSAFHQGEGPFDPNRRDVTFSVAASRREVEKFSGAAPPQALLAALPRVAYSFLLLRAAGQGTGLPPPAAHPPFQHEQPPTFQGTTRERAVESSHRVAGLAGGGIVEGKIYRGSPSRRTLALTFDDGPVPIYTTLLLDTLDRLSQRATFFLIGQRVQEYPYFAREIVRRGHETGNHTFHHLNLTRLAAAEMTAEIGRAQEVITAVTGRSPRYFRPPGGDYNAAVLRIAANLGLVTVFWTDDPGDYARPDPLLLEAKLLARVSNGGILLLHQGVEETIRLLPLTVDALRRRGFTITSVSALVGR